MMNADHGTGPRRTICFRFRMTFRISFRSGIKQSFQATKYFRSVAEGLTNMFIPTLEPRQYVVGFPTGEMLPLRVWSSVKGLDDRLDELLEWVGSLHRDIRSLHRGATRDRELQHMVRNWLDIHCDGETFFLEQFPPSRSPEFDDEAAPDLSIGVLGGHTVMVSTDTLMYVRLDDDVYGLALARHGSYLLEEVKEGDAPAGRAA